MTLGQYLAIRPEVEAEHKECGTQPQIYLVKPVWFADDPAVAKLESLSRCPMDDSTAVIEAEIPDGLFPVRVNFVGDDRHEPRCSMDQVRAHLAAHPPQDYSLKPVESLFHDHDVYYIADMALLRCVDGMIMIKVAWIYDPRMVDIRVVEWKVWELSKETQKEVLDSFKRCAQAFKKFCRGDYDV